MTLYALDLFGTAVFAISGVLLACRNHMDFFGALVLAFVTAVGGGTIRDALLGSTPVFWIQNTHYLWVILGAVILGLATLNWMVRIRRILQIFDAMGLAVFSIAGAQKALAFGAEPVVAIIMGVLTGAGGGAIRDMLAGQVPMVLKQEELYATPAIIGCLFYLLLLSWSVNPTLATVLAGLLIFSTRMISVIRKIALPRIALPG